MTTTICTALRFLSTLSLRRATLTEFCPTLEDHNFYPRSPCGERLQLKPPIKAHRQISIHALLAESDHPQTSGRPHNTDFYPRSPCGERRAKSIEHYYNHCISIHALLAESDSKSAQNSGALLRIWNKFYGDCIFMLTGKAVFYPFCPCFFHIFWCEGSGNFMIAFPSH